MLPLGVDFLDWLFTDCLPVFLWILDNVKAAKYGLAQISFCSDEDRSPLVPLLPAPALLLPLPALLQGHVVTLKPCLQIYLGGRRQEAGGNKQEIGGRRQETRPVFGTSEGWIEEPIMVSAST